LKLLSILESKFNLGEKYVHTFGGSLVRSSCAHMPSFLMLSIVRVGVFHVISL
jgi:hypothetical protein